MVGCGRYSESPVVWHDMYVYVVVSRGRNETYLLSCSVRTSMKEVIATDSSIVTGHVVNAPTPSG